MSWSAVARPGPLSDRRFRMPLWAIIGVAGWGGLVLLAAQLLAKSPPAAGFDLDLLLSAGRRVAAGLSPYEPGLPGGGSIQAESLFYSYPPPVAQLVSFVSSIPNQAVLAIWGLGATAAFAVIGRALVRQLRASGRRSAAVSTTATPGAGRLEAEGAPIGELVLATLAILPFIFPYTVALLFGNLDAWFPAIYGAVLLGVVAGNRAGWVGAGAAVAVATVAKLHPVSLLVWLGVRGWPAPIGPRAGDGSPAAGRTRRASTTGAMTGALAAVAVGLAIVAVSVAVWGIAPWQDYLGVLRSGSAADLVDRRNIGIASQLAGLLSLGETGARLLQVAVSLGAIALTAWAARTRRDPVESLVWAATASLLILPVTWFHYPIALLPFAVVAVARSGRGSVARRVGGVMAGAILVAIVAVGLPVLIWAAVALVIVAVRWSAPAGAAQAGSAAMADRSQA